MRGGTQTMGGGGQKKAQNKTAHSQLEPTSVFSLYSWISRENLLNLKSGTQNYFKIIGVEKNESWVHYARFLFPSSIFPNN